MPPLENHQRTAKWLLATSLLGGVVCTTVASARLRGLMINSLWLTLGTLALSLPLGTFLAVVTSKTSVVGRDVMKRLMVGLLFVPLFVQATAWQAALGQTGWLLPSGNHSFKLAGWYGAIWVHGMAAIAWVVLCVGAALRNVPREFEEEALQDSSDWRVLWRVSVRRAGAGLAAAALWIGVICFGEITVTDLFQIRTFAEEIYTTANLGALDLQLTSLKETNSLAGGVPQLAVGDLWLGTLLVVLLVLAALATVWAWLPSSGFTSADDNWTLILQRGRWPLTLAAWLLTAGIIGLPLASLLGKAGARTELVQQRMETSWSAGKAATMVVRSPWEHRREGQWSFMIGGLAVIGATTVGVLLAWGLRTSWLPPLPTALMLAIGFAIPGPLLAVWVIRLMNQPDGSPLSFLSWCYDHTILAPVVVQLLRALPLTTLVLTAQFASVPQDLLDSAKSEGARSWRLLLGIVLPLSWPGLLAAACMAMVVAVGDMAATLLVLPPGVSTLSTRIFGLLHYGAEDRVSALCFALALGFGALATAAWRLPRGVRIKAP